MSYRLSALVHIYISGWVLDTDHFKLISSDDSRGRGKRGEVKIALSCSKWEWLRSEGDPFLAPIRHFFRRWWGGFLRSVNVCGQSAFHVPGGVSLSNKFPGSKKKGLYNCKMISCCISLWTHPTTDNQVTWQLCRLLNHKSSEGFNGRHDSILLYQQTCTVRVVHVKWGIFLSCDLKYKSVWRERWFIICINNVSSYPWKGYRIFSLLRAIILQPSPVVTWVIMN